MKQKSFISLYSGAGPAGKDIKRIRRLAVVIMPITMLLFGFFQSSAVSHETPGQEHVKDNVQHQVSVIRKLIYVIVTDDKGRPVTDLNKDDFILTDNGKEMIITEFENHTLSLSVESQEPVAVPVEKPSAVNTPVPLMNRVFLYLFDLVFTDQGGFRLAREAALRSMEKELEPDVLVGVLTFSGSRALNVLHQPDRNREAARRAIESIRAGNLMPLAPNRLPQTDPQIRISRSIDDVYSRDIFNQGASDLLAGRIVAENFIWAMESFAQAMRYVQGRKVVILYSTGLHPAYIGRGRYYNSGNTDLGRAYDELCRRLADANVSVFSVNTEENTYFLDSAMKPETERGISVLREIASRTGGQFTGDIYAAPDHIEKIEILTGAYYVLGYPIEESWKGEYHKIKVRVRKPGCKVLFQPGYFSDKPFAAFTELEKKIHLVDIALATRPLTGEEPVRFTVQVALQAPSPPKNIRFVARVPVKELGEVAGSRVEAVSLIFDELDRIVDTSRAELDLTSPEYRRQPVSIRSELSAKAGTYKCRLVLRNMDTGRAAVAAALITVPEPDRK